MNAITPTEPRLADGNAGRSSAPEVIVSYEPATGEELWRGRVSDIDTAVKTARRAFPAWAAQPLSTRMELMRRFANEVRKDFEKLADTISRETGKPLWEANAEVENVINKVELSIRAYADRTAQRKLDSAIQGMMAVRHKPHGVMAVLGPYNMPAHLPNAHIVPALIAGNTVVFKPSEKAPATGELLARCFNRAGISAAVIQCVFGGPEQGQELVRHESVNGVLFTGSANSGVAIARKLAARPDKLLTLEMGGNNPIVMWDTPKITDAAALIVQSAFASAGQRCTAARRLIIKESMYDPIMAEVKSLADRIIFGAPFDEPAPFMGPMIDNFAADGLTDSFFYLLSNGGKAIKHLVRPDEKKPFLSPAIIDMTAMKDRPDVELFGPILQVIRVNDLDQAISEANNTALRSGCLDDRRPTAGIQPLLGQRARRYRQLEPTDDQSIARRADRRHRAFGQSSSLRALRGGLLRLSGGIGRG